MGKRWGKGEGEVGLKGKRRGGVTAVGGDSLRKEGSGGEIRECRKSKIRAGGLEGWKQGGEGERLDMKGF